MQKGTVSEYRGVFLALIAFLVAFFVWQSQGLSFVTYPLRLFVTMIHELGHGLSAILTGGEFLRFEVSKRGAGLAYTRGGSRFVVIQAGYLGTAIFGAILLYLANRSKRPGPIAVGVGLFIGVLTLLFSGLSLSHLNVFEAILTAGVIIVGSWLFLTRETDEGRYVGLGTLGAGVVMLLIFAGANNGLTILIGLLSAVLLVVMGLRAPVEVTVFVLTLLAFLTGLQAITDSWTLLKIVSLPNSMIPNNDASSMAREIGGSAGLWAILWIAGDAVLFGTSVYLTFVGPARRGELPPAQRT